MKNWRFVFLVSVLIVALSALLVAPIPIVVSSDFGPLYAASLAAIRGGPLYDVPFQQGLLAESVGKEWGSFPIFPPAYPPWYYLFLAPLGFFSIELAARLWFLFGVAATVFFVIAITEQGSFRQRLWMITLVLAFPPLVGHLIVGQLSLPLILGAGIVSTNFFRPTGWRIALALVAFSLKPHLGAPLIAAILGWSLATKPSGMIKACSVMFTLIITASFALEPGWMISWPQSLQALSGHSLNNLCDTCSSGTIFTARIFGISGANLWLFGMVSLGFAVLCSGVIAYRIGKSEGSVRLGVAVAAILTLLATPYARNYDYCLLLIPLCLLAVEEIKQSIVGSILLISSYAWAAFIVMFTERTNHGAFLWVSVLPVLIIAIVQIRRIALKEIASVFPD